MSFLPAHLVFPRGGARGCASQETYRLIASRNMVCSLSVHDSRDLVIVYALRVFAASIIAAEVFIAARTCVWFPCLRRGVPFPDVFRPQPRSPGRRVRCYRTVNGACSRRNVFPSCSARRARVTNAFPRLAQEHHTRSRHTQPRADVFPGGVFSQAVCNCVAALRFPDSRTPGSPRVTRSRLCSTQTWTR